MPSEESDMRVPYRVVMPQLAGLGAVLFNCHNYISVHIIILAETKLSFNGIKVPGSRECDA